MNPETNELAALSDEQQDLMKSLEDQLKDLGPDWEPVPKHLEHAAFCVLKGEDRGTISRTSGGALSKHAANRRAQLRQGSRR